MALYFVMIICYAGNSCHLGLLLVLTFAEMLKKKVIEAYRGTDGKEVCSCSSLLSVILSLIKCVINLALHLNHQALWGLPWGW